MAKALRNESVLRRQYSVSKKINIVKKGTSVLCRVDFTDLKAGDTFFIGGLPYVAGNDVCCSADTENKGYPLYDDEGNG